MPLPRATPIGFKRKPLLIEVYFVNNDTYAEHRILYIKHKEPTDKWLKSLYDGVNEPKGYRILGQITPVIYMHST